MDKLEIITDLRKKYKELYNENAPAYNYDEFNTFDEYVKYMNDLIDQKRNT